MNYITLCPAYGRDYKSKAAVLDDFQNGKDFMVADYMSPWNGKPATRAELLAHYGNVTVNIRYEKNRRVAVVKLGGK